MNPPAPPASLDRLDERLKWIVALLAAHVGLGVATLPPVAQALGL